MHVSATQTAVHGPVPVRERQITGHGKIITIFAIPKQNIKWYTISNIENENITPQCSYIVSSSEHDSSKSIVFLSIHSKVAMSITGLLHQKDRESLEYIITLHFLKQ